jgi:hypothetical protein
MDGFNKLQELGSKTISSATHIPVAHVESILNKKFEKFQRPQFFGFLSILEREYKVDLSGLKHEFLFARAEIDISQDRNDQIAETSSKLFEKKKAILKNKKVQYVIAGSIVALLVFILISVVDFSSTTVAKIEINNTAIDQAKKNLNLKPVDVSNVEDMMQNNEVESAEFGQDTQEANGSISKDETIQESKNATDTLGPVSSNEPVMPLYLRIIPKGKLWLGIINAETHKRRAETITEPLVLDANKNWLIATGYGHLDMDCGDATNKYREDKQLLFLYENGICQIIDKEEFKARNGGKLW